MPELFDDIQKERGYVALLLAAGVLRFLNLGFLDLQAWDEALYAVRAEGILMFGGIFDQTSFSIGGLYSSLHPPLYVWLTSLSFFLFGVTEFAARFFSAFLGALTLFVIYRIGKELQHTKLGFVAAMLYGFNSFVTFQARQGQFDTSLVFFLAISILFYLKLELRGKTRYAVYAGLAIGAALMTKLFVGFGIPLTYFLWKILTQGNERKASWSPFLISLAVTILVALPWHFYMTIAQGIGNPLFFLDASAVFERSLYGIEGNIKPLEAFYFVNQLFVLFPMGIFWFVFGLYRIFRDKDRRWMLLASWFIVFFVVFTLMRTKLSVYVLPMLVPASLIAARAVLEFVSGAYSNRSAALLLGGTGVSLLWASNQEWRNLAKSIPSDLLRVQLPPSSAVWTFLPFLMMLVCIILFTYALLKNQRIPQICRALPTLLILPSFLMSFYNVVGYDQFQFNDGARDLARLVAERQPSAIVVAGFDRNPQLTFYLEGADIGWRDDIEISRTKPPAIRSQFREWLSEQTSNLPGDALVIAEKDKFIRYEWVTSEEVNPPDYSLIYDSRRYAVFQRLHSTNVALNSRRLP